GAGMTTNRLMDILKSRAVDLPHIVHESENPTLFDVKDSKGHEGVHELPRISTQQKQENLNGSIWGTTTPLFGQSLLRFSLSFIIQDEISASPAEIARAYMGSRTSEAGPIFKSMVEKGESSGLRGDDAAIKPYVPSPSAKSSTCWPGAMVQDAYLTPRSQRGRYGLHNFSRTPYSRTIFSKSKPRFTQMQGEYNHIPSTPSHQSETPIYGQVKLRTDTLEGGYGSVGPIRRTRNKIGAESSLRRSAYFHSSINGPSQVEKFNALPGIVRNLEPGETSGTPKFPLQDGKPHFSEVGVPTVHSHTSLIARQILEHIDRNPPTPKEKSDELKLTIKWKKPDFSDVSTVLSNEKNGLVHQGNSDVIVPPPESDHRVNDVLNKGYTSSEMNFGSMLTNNGRTTADFISTPDLLIKPTYEDVTKIIPDAGNFDVNLQQKPLLHTSVMKPLLPSISVNNSRWMFASDNSSGFTFPVSASSSVLSEPPTPSIVPSFSAGGLHPSKEESTIPTYSFGSKRTSAPLAFTFPSTSTATVQDDACDIKFSFGSDEKTRLSFSSFGKNAICY
ncbi:Nuclear pore complex protein NUP1, partial [Quillaja saponaria]